ncbi:MAG: phosphoribosylamine--glycine ligase [Thermoleophilia bacterium]|nr:phosphoribosylamine--glycine ligase [Thermoleophilia bacterium]
MTDSLLPREARPETTTGTRLRVLIVGGGGRDHALAHAFAKSPLLGDLHAVPGNGGIAELGTCHPDIDPNDFAAVANLAREIKADLAVIGAEDLLVAGLTDAIEAAGVAVFGPRKDAAQLEGSKIFSKTLMDNIGIPTADWRACSTPDEARAAVTEFGGAAAVKANGLALGCGAYVCFTPEAAEAAITTLMVDQLFGEAGATVIVERLMEGEEVSVMALTDGTHVVPLPAARDYKRLRDGDEGPNTGGMGAHAPSTDLSAGDAAALARDFIQPVVDELRILGTPFRGVIYAGIMLTARGPRALEYNCRFGNPETQALVRILDADLLQLVHDAAVASLAGVAAVEARGVAVAVCVATENYPDLQLEPAPVVLSGLTSVRAIEGVEAFIGFGTKMPGTRDQMLALGGRAVTVSAWAPTMEAAIDRAYRAVDALQLPNSHFRSDIGAPAISTIAAR